MIQSAEEEEEAAGIWLEHNKMHLVAEIRIKVVAKNSK